MNNFLDNYIFLFKEYCNYILAINTVSINPTTFLGIFLFGWLTSLNPCSLSIIPIYLSYINNKTEKSGKKISVLFIVGFFLNFITIGLILIYFGKLYRQFFSSSDLTSGILLVFIGITLLDILPITKFKFIGNTSLDSYIGPDGYLRPITIGFSSGIITSACNIPVVIALLTWVSSLHNIVQAIFLLVIYIIGYSFSIFFVSFLTVFLKEVKLFNQLITLTTSLLGSALLSSGVFSLCRFFKF
nr:dsbD [Erythrotrichia welwitschii]